MQLFCIIGLVEEKVFDQINDKRVSSFGTPIKKEQRFPRAKVASFRAVDSIDESIVELAYLG